MEKTSTPGIYRRKGKLKTTYTYVVSAGTDVRTGKPKQITKGGFATIREAKEARAKVVTELEQGTLVEPSRDNVATYLRGWLERQKPRWRATTYTYHAGIIEATLIPRVGHHQLGKLKPIHVDQLVSDLLASGKTENTTRQYVDVLARALEAAVRLELLHRNPCDGADRPKVPKSNPIALSAADVARLLSEIRGHRFEVAILLCLLAAAREMEALGLRWRDVDLQSGIITIRHQLIRVEDGWEFGPTKDTDPRTFRMPETLWRALRAERARQAQARIDGEMEFDYDLVVCREDGTPYSRRCFQGAYGRLARKLELPTVKVHTLRHTASAHHQDAGTPLNVVANIMGHSDPARLTAGRYGALVPGSHEKAAARLEAFLQTALNEGEDASQRQAG